MRYDAGNTDSEIQHCLYRKIDIADDVETRHYQRLFRRDRPLLTGRSAPTPLRTNTNSHYYPATTTSSYPHHYVLVPAQEKFKTSSTAARDDRSGFHATGEQSASQIQSILRGIRS
jgi:hypothetical protein